MSFCPTKDLHSVYLDNELPLSYVKEYEEHIQNCAKCKAELESIKNLRSVLIQDEKETKFTKKEMDASFARLQMKMNYSKHTKPVQKQKSEIIKYVIPAMAAAAVFALVLPVGFKSKTETNNTVAAISPITQPSTVSLQNDNVVLSGNIPSGAVINATPVNTNNKKVQRKMIQDVDVFRPNFDNENTISIKITVPGINANPYTTEIDFPVDMLYTGSFE